MIIKVDDAGSMSVGGTIPQNKLQAFGALELVKQALQKHYDKSEGLIQQVPPGTILKS